MTSELASQGNSKEKLVSKGRPQGNLREKLSWKILIKPKLQARGKFQENPFTSRFHKGYLSNIYKRTKLICEFHRVIKKANLHTLKKTFKNPPHKHISHRKSEQHLEENQINWWISMCNSIPRGGNRITQKTKGGNFGFSLMSQRAFEKTLLWCWIQSKLHYCCLVQWCCLFQWKLKVSFKLLLFNSMMLHI